MTLNPYKTLGIEPGATKKQICAAYRKMASIHHPDKNPDDPYAKTRFQQVKEAYEILTDPDRLARYEKGEDPKKVDLRGLATGLLVSSFFEVLKTKGDRRIISNILQYMERKNDRAELKDKDIAEAMGNLDRVKERFSYNGSEENLFSDVIDSEYRKLEEALAGLNQEREVIVLAKKMLKAYSDNDPAELPNLMRGSDYPFISTTSF